jgi:hypothetical protein
MRPRAMPASVQAPAVGSRIALPVLLYFLAVMLPVKFALGPFDMSGVRLVLLAMIVPLTVQLLMGRFGRILLTDILFFLHFGWIVVALSMNNPTQVLSNAGSTGIEFLGGYVLGRAMIRTPADFVGLIKLLAVIALCTLPFAIYETLTGHAAILKALDALPGVRSLRDINIGKRLGLNRVQMVFVHPIHYGLFCTMALSLCFVGLKGIYSDSRRVLITVTLGFCGFLALSSGAFLAIVLQIILIGWAFTFRNTVWRWWLLVGLIALLYVGIAMLSTRSPIRVFMSYATFSSHTAYWRSIIFEWGMVNVWANPIFGLGLNDWVRPRWMFSGSMDNFWLVMAVRYGIPGFALLAAGYLIALWKIGRRDFDGNRLLWQFRRAWVFSFVGLTFTLCTVHVWDTIYSLVFFMFGAGMWMLTVPADAGAPAAADPAGRRPAATRRTPGPEPVRRRAAGPDGARDPQGDPAPGESAQVESAQGGPAVPQDPAPATLRYTRFQPNRTRSREPGVS